MKCSTKVHAVGIRIKTARVTYPIMIVGPAVWGCRKRTLISRELHRVRAAMASLWKPWFRNLGVGSYRDHFGTDLCGRTNLR